MEYSPDDPWPTHPESWWRETLTAAREWGWSLEHPSGHWGVIRCHTRACVFRINSSGKGSENPARDAKKRVERCPHNPKAVSVVAQIAERLSKASRLIDAAESMNAKDDAERRAYMLESAQELFDEDATWDEFGRLADEAERHEADAAAVFAEVGIDPMNSDTVLDLADGQVRQVRMDLQAKRLPAGRVKSLQAHSKELRARIVAARRL